MYIHLKEQPTKYGGPQSSSVQSEKERANPFFVLLMIRAVVVTSTEHPQRLDRTGTSTVHLFDVSKVANLIAGSVHKQNWTEDL